MDTILPDPATLALIMLRDDHDHITAVVRSTTTESRCPCCDTPTSRVHSRYQRTLLDLPWHGVAMYLALQVRRFFCDAPECARRIFTERLPNVVAPYARRTQRVDEWLTSIGLALGGEAGARLLRQFGLSRSPDTVLRRANA